MLFSFYPFHSPLLCSIFSVFFSFLFFLFPFLHFIFISFYFLFPFLKIFPFHSFPPFFPSHFYFPPSPSLFSFFRFRGLKGFSFYAFPLAFPFLSPERSRTDPWGTPEAGAPLRAGDPQRGLSPRTRRFPTTFSSHPATPSYQKTRLTLSKPRFQTNPSSRPRSQAGPGAWARPVLVATAPPAQEGP